MKGLAGYGFRTGLWTENGVDKIAWEVGQAGSRVQKLDVAWTGKGYQFAMDANKSAYDGILNNSDSRPFLWTVMGWAGIQRYAVAWTGDQSASWDYIRWHIPTLIGSGLSGQAYASGDVDAIFGGSPETYLRDLQWKSFTPVLMGMSGWAAAERKHPWWFDEPYRDINRRYLKLKMRLTPYMYTLVREAEQSGAPLVRGLMWDYPQDPAAYTEAYKYQFLPGPRRAGGARLPQPGRQRRLAQGHPPAAGHVVRLLGWPPGHGRRQGPRPRHAGDAGQAARVRARRRHPAHVSGNAVRRPEAEGSADARYLPARRFRVHPV